MFDVVKNPVLTHADVVLPQSAPNGSSFSATDAVVSTGFSFKPPLSNEEIYRLEWRILIQTCALQYTEYSKSGGKEWLPRILNTLQRINSKAQQFNPQNIPSDITPPTAEYLALSATGNWCDTLTHQLTCLFSSASNVDTLRIS